MTSENTTVHRFDVRVTRRDTDLALRRFFLREIGILMPVATALCLTSVALDARDGALTWLSVSILTLIGVLAAILVGAFLARRNQSHRMLRQIGDAPVRYTLTEPGIQAESPLGSSSLGWAAVCLLRIDDELVLPYFSRGTYTTIPTDQIPDAALAFLRERIAEHGGRVIDGRKSAA